MVLPVPGGPCIFRSAPRLRGQKGSSEDCLGVVVLTERMRFGTLPSSAMTCSRATASSFPTMSHINCGRYFSSYVEGEEGCR